MNLARCGCFLAAVDSYSGTARQENLANGQQQIRQADHTLDEAGARQARSYRPGCGDDRGSVAGTRESRSLPGRQAGRYRQVDLTAQSDAGHTSITEEVERRAGSVSV